MTTSTEKPRLATEIAQLWPPQGQWTEHDYLSLPDTNKIVELSEGVISVQAPPLFTHQLISGNIYRSFRHFVKTNNSGTIIFLIAIRLAEGKIRRPDIVFYTNEHKHRAGGTISGIPDLAMEVISPGSRTIDRREKFQEYAQAGIAEYWIVDPKTETIELFAIDEERAYTLVVKAEKGQLAHSKLLDGFEVSVEDVFEQSG